MSENATKKPRKVRADGVATRERILEVATSLFASGGYEATSLRQIAAASSIDIATLKYHFGDKPALFAEVYRQGHEAFLIALAPVLTGFDDARSAAQVRSVVRTLVVDMHAFIQQNLAFVRLVLFRMLEDSADVISQEDDLQKIALATLEQTFQRLIDRGVIRPIDPRAFVVFLIASFPMWQVTGRVKTDWLGEPALESAAGAARSEAFFITAVERMLGVEETP
jgi:AcrR family transcriptional regulator